MQLKHSLKFFFSFHGAAHHRKLWISEFRTKGQAYFSLFVLFHFLLKYSHMEWFSFVFQTKPTLHCSLWWSISLESERRHMTREDWRDLSKDTLTELGQRLTNGTTTKPDGHWRHQRCQREAQMGIHCFFLLLLPKWWLFADMNECKISQFITPNIKNIHIWVRHLFGPPKKIKNQLKFRFKGYIVAEGNSPLTLQLKY